MTKSTSTKDVPEYDDMLGWPLDEKNIVSGRVVKTPDGQAWVTYKGYIRVFPDHWIEDRPDLKSVPKGTQCLNLNGLLIVA